MKRMKRIHKYKIDVCLNVRKICKKNKLQKIIYMFNFFFIFWVCVWIVCNFLFVYECNKV
jgi:hypothetical protein